MDKSGSPEETLQMIECGSLDLNFPIKYGILLLGKTKVGKTTTSHYLTHQVLQGGFNNAKSIVYLLRNGERRFMQAKIGDKQTESQTQIPNFFDYEQNNQKIYLVDCPGYIDSFGCFRIISNRFFHYQVFSKVENIKFIVTFSYSHMLNMADLMKNTFKQFLKGFSNLNEIKEELVNATCIMVTGVPKQKDLPGVREKFQKSPLLTGQFKDFYTYLKKNLLQKNRIFMFQTAEIGVVCNTQNTLLKQINANTQFWKRKLNEKQQVDMSHIKISLLDYIQEDEEQFKLELQQLSNYYKQNIPKDIQNFTDIMSLLVKDNIAGGDSCQVIKKMQTVIEQKKRKRQTQSKCLDLYKKYEQKRKKLQQLLFKPNKATDSVAAYTDIPFWALRLKAQRQIEQLGQKIVSKEYHINQEYQALNDQQEMIKKMLDILIGLARAKKQRDPERDNLKNEAIMQLAYQIFKDIEISNKLYRLLKSTTNDKAGMKDIQKGLNFILVNYPSIIKNIFLKSMSKNSIQIFVEGLDKIKIGESMSSKAATELAKIFQQFKQVFQNKPELHEKYSEQLIQEVKTKLSNEIVKLNNNAFETIKKQANPNLSNLKQMEETRRRIVERIQESNKNAINNERMKVENNRIIQMMAQCLYKNSKVDLALKLYDSLYDGYKVLEILDTQEQNLRKAQKKEQQLLNLLVVFMEMAKKYKRTQLAMSKAQQAYHYAQQSANIDRIIQISKFIKQLAKKGASLQQSQNDPYISFMFRETSEVQIPREISQQILKLSEMGVGSGKKL